MEGQGVLYQLLRVRLYKDQERLGNAECDYQEREHPRRVEVFEFGSLDGNRAK